MRIPQEPKPRGSQRWLQIAVNRCPDVINSAIADALNLCPGEKIEWLSPLESDCFAEYRDAQFVKRLGVSLKCRPLKDFWPKRGPQWDGLARTNRDRLLLIEAKANIPELDSGPMKAENEDSIKKIKKSLAKTRKFLKVKSETDWSQCFYQYANRLAHLHLLKELNCLDAYLVFVYFVGDWTRLPDEDPVSREGWEGAVSLAEKHLGIPRHSQWVSESVKDVFIEASDMTHASDMAHISWP